MSTLELNDCLKSCGKSFFVQFFPVLNQIDWTSKTEISACKNIISELLKTQKAPDGKAYTDSGLKIRFTAFETIWVTHQEEMALINVIHSNRVPAEVREQAKSLLMKYFHHHP